MDVRVEEQAVQDGIRPAVIGDRDHDVTADRVVQVHARLERRDRLRGQHGARRRVADLHRLGPALVVPVDRSTARGRAPAPSPRLTSTVKLVGEYQTAATRLDEPGTCKARGSVEVVVQV